VLVNFFYIPVFRLNSNVAGDRRRPFVHLL